MIERTPEDRARFSADMAALADLPPAFQSKTRDHAPRDALVLWPHDAWVEGAIRRSYGDNGLANFCWHEPEDGQLAQFGTEGPLFGDFHFHHGSHGLQRALDTFEDACASVTGGAIHIECTTSAWFGVYDDSKED